MIEKMNEFFDKRVNGYDDHMKACIEDFDLYYEQVVAPLKDKEHMKVLLLGCGTGAEAQVLFKRFPNVNVTCYDVSEEMLKTFERKFSFYNIELRHESYFNMVEVDTYDYVISVMTMHHWSYEEKLDLYSKIYKSLKNAGLYIEGDYYVSKEKEVEYLLKKAEQLEGVDSDEFYHIDIPFNHETQEKLYKEVGFSNFERLYVNEEKQVHQVTCDKYTNL